MFILVDILRPFIGIFAIITMFLASSTAIFSSQTCELNLPEFLTLCQHSWTTARSAFPFSLDFCTTAVGKRLPD